LVHTIEYSGAGRICFASSNLGGTGVDDAFFQGIDGVRATVIGTVVRVLAVFAYSISACVWALAKCFIAFAAVSEDFAIFLALAGGTFNVLSTFSWTRIGSRSGPRAWIGRVGVAFVVVATG